jgi:hypothetical protein
MILLQCAGVLNVVTGAGVTGGALTAHPGVDKVINNIIPLLDWNTIL